MTKKQNEFVHIRIVVQTQRKSHGGTGKQRGPKTGKKGTIYVSRRHESEEVYGEPISAPTFKALKRLLRATGLIPTQIVIKKKGETCFVP